MYVYISAAALAGNFLLRGSLAESAPLVRIRLAWFQSSLPIRPNVVSVSTPSWTNVVSALTSNLAHVTPYISPPSSLNYSLSLPLSPKLRALNYFGNFLMNST